MIQIVYNRFLYEWLVLDERGAVIYEAATEHEAENWIHNNK